MMKKVSSKGDRLHWFAWQEICTTVRDCMASNTPRELITKVLKSLVRT